MATITIMDPVTRIEGHMKVELSIEANEVADAKCTGTLFRGFEKILQGRSGWDAPVITQRICGVCPISHAQASVLALDDAANVTPPPNARILRNLTLGANFVQSHILHFYLLAAFDFVRGPQTSPWVTAWTNDIRILDRSLSVLEAIEARRRAHEMGAIFGGKMPSSHTYIPGGFTATPDQSAINAYRAHLDWLTDFVRNRYIPDVETIARAYPDYAAIGGGCNNLMAYGVFELNDAGTDKLLRKGYVFNQGQSPSNGFDGGDITESVTHSWYAENTSDLTPANGATTPLYPKAGAYSWLKAPRLLDQPMEVGPLARMWINGDYRNGISVLDRHMSRALETLKIAEAMSTWLDELQQGQSVYDSYPIQTATGVGAGLTEAPRGALGHWVQLSSGNIDHYQVITPTCWNASPQDGNDVNGPMEQALIGTPIEDPDQPVEALRVIHSFDPCLSCAVHVIRPDKEPLILAADPGANTAC